MQNGSRIEQWKLVYILFHYKIKIFPKIKISETSEVSIAGFHIVHIPYFGKIFVSTKHWVSKEKKRWFHKRFSSWHFNNFVCNAAEIAAQLQACRTRSQRSLLKNFFIRCLTHNRNINQLKTRFHLGRRHLIGCWAFFNFWSSFWFQCLKKGLHNSKHDRVLPPN